MNSYRRKCKGLHGVAKSWTWLSDFTHTHSILCKKMFNLASSKKNTNRNCTKFIIFYLSDWQKSKSLSTHFVGQPLGNKYTVGGSAEWDHLSRREFGWQQLAKLHTHFLFGPSIPLLGNYPRKSLTNIQKSVCIKFIAALFVMAKD